MSLVSRLLSMQGSFAWRSFNRATQDPDATQLRLLRQILKANAETAFGREHGFASIGGFEEFRDSVQIGDYEAVRPWVNRIMAGERGVLTRDDPYLFAMTSGTAGQPKLIPVTTATSKFVGALSRLWLYRSTVDHPGTLDHKALIIVSPAIEGYTDGGIPYGSASGYIYRNAAWVVRRRYAVPYPVFGVKDYEAKYYAIMRFAIEQQLSLLATPNPSTILRLMDTANTHAQRLIRDVHDGTISDDTDIEPELRAELTSLLRPNAARAAELESILDREGVLRPRDYWPRLALVACWKGGSVGATVERLSPWFPDGMAFRDPGFLASEANFTLPIQDEGSRGILAVTGNVYEFIPEDDIDSSTPRILSASQLEDGESYYIIVTTQSGLYRYDINDVVRVNGFHNRTPKIEFLRKGRDMLSLEGEKLHVSQLIEAMREAQSSTGVAVEYFRALGHPTANRYSLQLELRDAAAPDDALVRLGRAVDEGLSRLNIEYEQKRESGRLHPLLIQVMADGWSSRRLAAKMANAVRDVQYKDALLALAGDDADESEVRRELAL